MVQFFKVCIKVFLILCIVTEIKSAPNSEESVYVTKDEGIRGTFGKLLSSIANINEKRLNALKTYNALDKYNAASGILRHADDEKEHIVEIILLNDHNPEATSGLLYKIYDNGPHEAPRYTVIRNILQIMNEHYDSEFEKSVVTNENEIRVINKLIKYVKEKSLKKQNDEGETSNGKDYYLRSWRSCTRKQKKRCKKACKKAFRAVCSDYKCSRGMKRSLRRHCKSECRDKFD